MPVLVQKKKRRSERGNWVVIEYLRGRIQWVKWCQTWAGVQMSKRNMEKSIAEYEKIGVKGGRVIIVDLDRAVDLAATEGANEIADLYRLFEK